MEARIETIQKQNEKEHNLLFRKLDEMTEHNKTVGEDVAVIKSCLVGNGREGALKKIDRHETYINEQAGAISVIYIVLVGMLIPLGLIVFRVYYGG